MTELKSELAAWCQSYVAAFNRNDAATIAAHWMFPAVTTAAGRSFSFKSVEHFTTNTEKLLAFYRAQHVDRVERQVVDIMQLHAGAAALTVSDVMILQDGADQVSWQAAYVLQRVQDTWRAVMAVADGEMQAWDARGTPLGG